MYCLSITSLKKRCRAVGVAYKSNNSKTCQGGVHIVGKEHYLGGDGGPIELFQVSVRTRQNPREGRVTSG